MKITRRGLFALAVVAPLVRAIPESPVDMKAVFWKGANPLYIQQRPKVLLVHPTMHANMMRVLQEKDPAEAGP